MGGVGTTSASGCPRCRCVPPSRHGAPGSACENCDRVTWTEGEWAAAASSPDRGTKVADALVRYFDPGKWLLAQARLVSVSTEADPDGAPVLRAIYGHPNWPERTGLRRRLDQIRHRPGKARRPKRARRIGLPSFEISEPLGSYHAQLIPDKDGVYWWGDGLRRRRGALERQRRDVPLPAYWATLTPFCFSGFGDTLDRLTAQNMKRISFLVECLYAG